MPISNMKRRWRMSMPREMAVLEIDGQGSRGVESETRE